jgi:hypothetical protein
VGFVGDATVASCCAATSPTTSTGLFANSVTGAMVTDHQHGTHLHDLTTPGDNSAGVERDTTHLRAFSANGTVLIDAGRVVFALVDGYLLFEAGQHPIDDYFNGNPNALQQLCDASRRERSPEGLTVEYAYGLTPPSGSRRSQSSNAHQVWLKTRASPLARDDKPSDRAP